jgi:hypothetical protein
VRRAGISVILAAIVGAGAASEACGSSRTERPVASFASTKESGAAFEKIRDGWVEMVREVDARKKRDELRAMLWTFVARYPDDGATHMARAFLALILLDDKQFDLAKAQLDQLTHVPLGTTGDLVTIAQARWARMHGHATEALLLLEPKVGKNVDPIARAVFQQEIVACAIDAKLSFQAIAYMDTWLTEAGDEEHDAARARVVAEIARMDVDTLKEALRAMRGGGLQTGYSSEMMGIVVDRLAERALERQDSDLARLLLETDGGAPMIGGDAGAALAELAESTKGLNIVQGRAIGLLLPTEQPAVLRDEAAAVLRGVMWALGLPHGIRAVLPSADAPATKTKAATTANTKSTRLACPRAAYVGDTDEPKDDDVIRLIIRDDVGDAARNEDTLKELAGLGASVIIGGLDPKAAEAMLAFSDARDFPVIVLSAPPSQVMPKDFGFVLGTSRSHVYAALAAAVPEIAGKHVVAPVIDESERQDFPAHGGVFGVLTLDERAPISCDVTSAMAGQPRFPIGDWQRADIHAWLVTGGPLCARDVVDEIGSNGGKGTIALTLEASTELPMAKVPSGLRVIAASTGAIPIGPGDAPRDSELRRFTAAFGARLDWWTALGRDAATLARQAVLALSATEDSREATRVSQLHTNVRDRLASAHADLWSTDAQGFGTSRVIDRPICVMDLPPE